MWLLRLKMGKIHRSEYPAIFSIVLTEEIIPDFKNKQSPGWTRYSNQTQPTAPPWPFLQKTLGNRQFFLREAAPEKKRYGKEEEGANLWIDRAAFLKLSSSKQQRNVTFIFLHNWSTLKNPNKCAWKSDKQLFMDPLFIWITLLFHGLWLWTVQLYVLNFSLRISWYRIMHSFYLKCELQTLL